MEANEDLHILFAKKRTQPIDRYEEYFSSIEQCRPFFADAIESHFQEENLSWIIDSIKSGKFSAGRDPSLEKDNRPGDLQRYGGIIFTSQRAVEAFGICIGKCEPSEIPIILPETLDLYTIGPTTSRLLRSLRLECQVVGDASGNGEELAHFIIKDSKTRRRVTQPLLFLTCESRNGNLTRILESDNVVGTAPIKVIEKNVYEIRENPKFAAEFASGIGPLEANNRKEQWIVLFSSTGCRAVFRELAWLSHTTSRYDPSLVREWQTKIFIATIGPTTREFCVKELGFEPHVCSPKPDPQSLGRAITSFKKAASVGVP